jgi:acyl carrier protein phosphodiesterase
MNEATKDLQENYTELEHDFTLFFPLLMNFAADELASHF